MEEYQSIRDKVVIPKTIPVEKYQTVKTNEENNNKEENNILLSDLNNAELVEVEDTFNEKAPLKNVKQVVEVIDSSNNPQKHLKDLIVDFDEHGVVYPNVDASAILDGQGNYFERMYPGTKLTNDYIPVKAEFFLDKLDDYVLDSGFNKLIYRFNIPNEGSYETSINLCNSQNAVYSTEEGLTRVCKCCGSARIGQEHLAFVKEQLSTNKDHCVYMSEGRKELRLHNLYKVCENGCCDNVKVICKKE